jgi:SAM-dependent methyltransferase
MNDSDSACEYSLITEKPGDGAHLEQLSALVTRYNLAASHCDGKDVLEVCCGAGIGLSYLAARARSVCGGDIDPTNMAVAKENNAGISNVTVRPFDALEPPFAPDSFDVIVAFECIYYFADMAQFLTVARRLLRPSGVLMISSVNCEWHGFNPSPFSRSYLTLRELAAALDAAGFQAVFFRGFYDGGDSFARQMRRRIRKAAVALHLIPKGMKGKAWLKRVFYGKLASLPPRLTHGIAPVAELEQIGPDTMMKSHKFIYVSARCP